MTIDTSLFQNQKSFAFIVELIVYLNIHLTFAQGFIQK